MAQILRPQNHFVCSIFRRNRILNELHIDSYIIPYQILCPLLPQLPRERGKQIYYVMIYSAIYFTNHRISTF